MTSNTTKADSSQLEAEAAPQLFDNWFDPIETEVRARAREFIEELIRGELDAVLARPRYGRSQMAQAFVVPDPHRSHGNASACSSLKAAFFTEDKLGINNSSRNFKYFQGFIVCYFKY
jgi:hypothetical protein